MHVPGVFEGLRVVDVTRGMAGGLATMVLADNGADVVRVEPAVPDRVGDLWGDAAGPVQWHRGKERLALDLHHEADRGRFFELVDGADVLVESFRPQVMARLGLGYDRLGPRNARLVHASITGFGPVGRLRDVPAYEGVVAAATGRMADLGAVLGLGRPAFSTSPILSFAASQGALQGIAAALHVRSRTGRGQHVATSLVQGTTAFDLYDRLLGVQLAERGGAAKAMPDYGDLTMAQIPAYLPAQARDGAWVQLANYAPHLFWSAAALVGLGHLQEDPDYAGLPLAGTPEVRLRFWTLMLDAVQRRDVDDLLAAARVDGNVGIARILSTEQGMDHPQARHNGDVVAVDDAELGATEQLGPLVDFAATPSRIGGRPGSTPCPAICEEGTEASPRHPLDGLLVVEAAQYYAAPFGPSLLADLGARVIKIESIEGDPMRAALGIQHAKTLQGKESVAVDLRRPEGAEVVRRIADRADIFLHNYRPGVPERLGIDHATLAARNPSLVYLYVGAFGHDGPDARMPGYHPMPGAITGAALRQSGRGGTSTDLLPPDERLEVSERLHRANEGSPDSNTALVAATAMLLGLVGRDRLGVGQELQVTMLGANAYVQSDDWIRFEGKAPRREVDPGLHGLDPLYRLYEARSGWVFLACTTDAEWARFVDEVGRSAGPATGAPSCRLPEGAWSTADGRARDAGRLTEVLEELFLERTADEWQGLLLDRGVACVRADQGGTEEFLLHEPSVRENGFVAEVASEEWGTYLRQSALTFLSESTSRLGPACRLGDGTRAILREVGYDDDEIDRLVEARVVAEDR